MYEECVCGVVVNENIIFQRDFVKEGSCFFMYVCMYVYNKILSKKNVQYFLTNFLVF